MKHYATTTRQIRRLWILRTLCTIWSVAALALTVAAYNLGDILWFGVAAASFCVNVYTTAVNWFFISPAPRK